MARRKGLYEVDGELVSERTPPSPHWMGVNWDRGSASISRGDGRKPAPGYPASRPRRRRPGCGRVRRLRSPQTAKGNGTDWLGDQDSNLDWRSWDRSAEMSVRRMMRRLCSQSAGPGSRLVRILVPQPVCPIAFGSLRESAKGGRK